MPTNLELLNLDICQGRYLSTWWDFHQYWFPCGLEIGADFAHFEAESWGPLMRAMHETHHYSHPPAQWWWMQFSGPKGKITRVKCCHEEAYDDEEIL